MCTLYPMAGHFLALVVTGRREEEGMPALLSSLSDEARELYHRTPISMGGRWLMLKVDSEASLSDLLHLARLRAAS